MAPRKVSGQGDLLAWKAPEVTKEFPAPLIRASSLAGTFSRGVAVALNECGRTREDVARRMSLHLGRTITVNMLNAYASTAREDHQISVPRFAALLHATEDSRLLELLAQPMDWAVIHRRHLPLIELAALQEHQDELRRQADALRRQARNRGGL